MTASYTSVSKRWEPILCHALCIHKPCPFIKDVFFSTSFSQMFYSILVFLIILNDWCTVLNAEECTIFFVRFIYKHSIVNLYYCLLQSGLDWKKILSQNNLFKNINNEAEIFYITFTPLYSNYFLLSSKNKIFQILIVENKIKIKQTIKIFFFIV